MYHAVYPRRGYQEGICAAVASPRILWCLIPEILLSAPGAATGLSLVQQGAAGGPAVVAGGPSSTTMRWTPARMWATRATAARRSSTWHRALKPCAPRFLRPPSSSDPSQRQSEPSSPGNALPSGISSAGDLWHSALSPQLGASRIKQFEDCSGALCPW